MLIALALRVKRDEAGVIERARSGGEILVTAQAAPGT
jgi:hypothetical protein